MKLLNVDWECMFSTKLMIKWTLARVEAEAVRKGKGDFLCKLY